jgi:hypothetical protein
MLNCPFMKLWNGPVIGNFSMFKASLSEPGTCKHVLPVLFVELELAVVEEVGAGADCPLFRPAKQAMIDHFDCRFTVDSDALDIEG